MRRKIDIGGKDQALNTTKDSYPRSDLFPTGCTLLNLALSDDPYGGFAKGTFANFIGDRSSGKTFLSWSILAEINAYPDFEDYDLYYDDAEHRLRIAVKKMFGSNILDRVQLMESNIIEDYYNFIRGRLDKKKPFVDILDSFDSLEDREAAKRKELKKDYPAKTALFTEMFRKVKSAIRYTESFLVVVSQVRENIGVMIGPKKRRTGGDALGHYAAYEIWLIQKGLVISKGLTVGTHTLVKITKNNVTGRLGEVEFDILRDYGIDDLGSMIDWMCNKGFWKREKGKQNIDLGDDFSDITQGKQITRNKLRKAIDERKSKSDLISIVTECWRQLEDEVKTDLEPRYE